MIRVDSHVHVWRLDRGDYHWITPAMSIHRDYGLDDLRPHMGSIDAVVLVQAAPTDAETDYLLEVANGSPKLVRGVVGWTDLAAPGAAKRIHELAKDPLLKGLRAMLQDIEDPYWIMREEVKPALQAMTEAGLCLDLLIEPRHLALMPIFANFHPKLKIVIDHAAKPPITSRSMNPWADDLARVGRDTNIHCKFSGLATLAGPLWQINHLRPWVEHMFRSFGPSRIMWGSDWPVLEQASTYERWLTISERFLFFYHIPERDEIMCDTAVRFYGLK
jgi:L-fuconolactonase